MRYDSTVVRLALIEALFRFCIPSDSVIPSGYAGACLLLFLSTAFMMAALTGELSVAIVGPKPFDVSANHADIVLRSEDSMDFHVPRAMLTSASAFFANLLEDADPVNEVTEDGKLIIKLHDSCGALEPFLSFLHPCGRPVFRSTVDVLSIHALARKYTLTDDLMTVIRDHAVAYLPSSPSGAEDPVLLYCVGIQLEAPRIAQDAARRCLDRDFKSLALNPVFRLSKSIAVTMRDVQRLLDYHDRVSRALRAGLCTDTENINVWLSTVDHPYILTSSARAQHTFSGLQDDIRQIYPSMSLSMPMVQRIRSARIHHHWLSMFIDEVVECLQVRPSGLIPQQRLPLLEEYWRSSSCIHCKTTLSTSDALGFLQLMSDEVDRIISGVRSSHPAFSFMPLLTMYYRLHFTLIENFKYQCIHTFNISFLLLVTQQTSEGHPIGATELIETPASRQDASLAVQKGFSDGYLVAPLWCLCASKL